jgi:hypothetical protein
MRHSLYGGMLLAAAAAIGGPATAHAQSSLLLGGPPGYTARGQFYEGGDVAIPGRPSVVAPLPTGNPGGNGFYAATEFLIYSQTFALGRQDVAFRGLVDTAGILTGAPGTQLGSFQVALNTSQFGRRSFQPGYKFTLGYKFENGLAVYATFGQLVREKYAAGASSATPLGRNTADLADSYLYSPVFNFSPDYSGPVVKTAFDVTSDAPFGSFYGIWNGATVMSIEFEQQFTHGDIAARVPVLQTEYSRVYGLGGFRYAWFYDRFFWRTVATDIEGVSFPSDVALYKNFLSQRMYGPMLGCGHEIYVGNRLGINLDLTGSLLASVVKERAYYELGDKTTKNKFSRNEFDLVPNANLDVGVMWYPIEGVQLRAGYTLQTFYATKQMGQPIAFNHGALDPQYDTLGFRYVQGFQFGVGFFF